jgi:hypothetical protein
MSTSYIDYLAIIPEVWMKRDGDHHELVKFLFERGVAELSGLDVQFSVQESEDGRFLISAVYWRRDGDHHPGPLLSRLIEQNKICLVYVGAWSSGGGSSYEDEEEQAALYSPCGAIAEAETLPTLVLQELLAKRTEGMLTPERGDIPIPLSNWRAR